MPSLDIKKVQVSPPKGMEHVGWWCDDCCGERMRRLDGASVRFPDKNQRCGVDYGEGVSSHLNVRPMFVPLPTHIDGSERG